MRGRSSVTDEALGIALLAAATILILTSTGHCQCPGVDARPGPRRAIVTHKGVPGTWLRLDVSDCAERELSVARQELATQIGINGEQERKLEIREADLLLMTQASAREKRELARVSADLARAKAAIGPEGPGFWGHPALWFGTGGLALGLFGAATTGDTVTETSSFWVGATTFVTGVLYALLSYLDAE